MRTTKAQIRLHISAFVIFFNMQSLEARATFCTEPDWFEACRITLYPQRDIFALNKGPVTILAVNSKYPCGTEQMHWPACAFLCPMYHRAGFHCAAHVLVKVMAKYTFAKPHCQSVQGQTTFANFIVSLPSKPFLPRFKCIWYNSFFPTLNRGNYMA